MIKWSWRQSCSNFFITQNSFTFTSLTLSLLHLIPCIVLWKRRFFQLKTKSKAYSWAGTVIFFWRHLHSTILNVYTDKELHLLVDEGEDSMQFHDIILWILGPRLVNKNFIKELAQKSIAALVWIQIEFNILVRCHCPPRGPGWFSYMKLSMSYYPTSFFYPDLALDQKFNVAREREWDLDSKHTCWREGQCHWCQHSVDPTLKQLHIQLMNTQGLQEQKYNEKCEMSHSFYTQKKKSSPWMVRNGKSVPPLSQRRRGFWVGWDWASKNQ